MLLATAKKINAQRAFFRHIVEEERVVSMLLSVIQTGRWYFPPPLAVECKRAGQTYYWVLDGHHRLHVAKILAAKKFGNGKVWAFVVPEKEYNALIKAQFAGEEPARIAPVRDHIYTPAGSANLIDENWASIRQNFQRGTFIHKPIYVYEKHGAKVQNIGHLSMRTNQNGKISVVHGREIEGIFKIKGGPSAPKRVNGYTRLEMQSDEGREFELPLDVTYTQENQSLRIDSGEDGLLVSDVWLGVENSSNAASTTVQFENNAFLSQARSIMMAMRIKSLIASQWSPEGYELSELVPAYFLDEFEFEDPIDFLFDEFKEVERAERPRDQFLSGWT